MILVMGTLVVNLFAVMIDRWPWKVKHTGFVCAHIGIIVLLTGALITQYFGVDGSVSFGVGERTKTIIVNEQEFNVYSLNASGMINKLYDHAQATGQDVDFFRHSPQKKPFQIP